MNNGTAPKTYDEAVEEARRARENLRNAFGALSPGSAVGKSPWSAIAIAAAAGFMVGLNPKFAQKFGMELARRWLGDIV